MGSFLLTFNTYWNSSAATIMVVSNILTIIIGRYAIQVRGLGPSIPISSNLGGFGLPELLATMSLGHILGAGTILGLTNLGVLPY